MMDDVKFKQRKDVIVDTGVCFGLPCYCLTVSAVILSIQWLKY